MNVLRLKGKMVEMNLSAENVSKEIGINKSTFYRKLKAEQFTVREASKIAQCLKLTGEEMTDIFFAQ